MSTSLADQLRRLATPQTAQLVDSKKRASILFDAKEAANKDRETIYDIGLSGLHELAANNPAFLQFEQTLFDRSAKDLVRSVESSEANRNLDQTVRRFFVHLSPHVLLQSAHKCLEWLIRRFSVHEHNIDDFLLLLLPYHETRIFVRCVQILSIKDPKHRWHWLHVLQKPGVPLAKLVLFNRTATDGHLQKLIGRHVLDAVSELDLRAYSLQSLYAFYATTMLGALEVSETVTDKFVANIQTTLLKGLGSAVVDLCAASMMIVAYLFTRVPLKANFLDAVIQRLARVSHPGLQSDAVVLIVLCFQHQTETLTTVSEEVLQSIVGARWLVPALSGVCAAQLHILPFFVPLMSAALRQVQQKATAWKECKAFCETILVEVQFAGGDIEAAIRCILDAYVLREKPDPDVIVIESDNEDDDDVNGIQLYDGNMEINQWYSELLKLLDRQYPKQFEQITKEIMQCSTAASANDADQQNDDDNDDGTFVTAPTPATLSHIKRKSLQTVLGFLFTAACADDGSNIFENLYHHCTENRVAAMRYLVKNYDSLCFSDDSKKLLRDSIAERLADDSPAVVLEVLKLDVAELVQLLDPAVLVDKLRAILTRSLGDERWHYVAKEAIKLITCDTIVNDDNADLIFLSLWPYLWPARPSSRQLFDAVVSSPFRRRVACFEDLAKMESRKTSKYSMATLQHGFQMLGGQNKWPGLERMLPVIRRTVLLRAPKKGVRKAFYALLLLAQVPRYLRPQLAVEIIETAAALVERLRPSLVVVADIDGDDMHAVVAHMLEKNVVPTAVIGWCLQNIVARMDGRPLDAYDFTPARLAANADLQFRLRTFVFALDRVYERDGEQYAPTLSTFLQRALPRPVDVLEFFGNFFVAHRIREAGITAATQVKAIRVLEKKLATIELGSGELTLTALVNMLAGLTSPFATVRKCTLRCLDALAERAELPDSQRLLLERVLAHREELHVDETQLLWILYRVFAKSKELKKMLGDIFELIGAGQKPLENANAVSPLLHAIVLDLFKHINDADWLRRIAPGSLRVLRAANDEWTERRAAGHSGLCILDPFQSDIIKSTLFRLNGDTVSVLRASGGAVATDAWQFVLLALSSHQLLLQISRGANGLSEATTSAAIVAMEVFDGDLFAALPAKHQSELVRNVLRISCESADADVLLAIGKLMRRIRLDVGLHVDVFEAMIAVEGTTVGEPKVAATATTPKKRKQPPTGPAQLIVCAEILNTVEWRSGNAFMEFLQNKKELHNAHTILPGLFGVLRRCLQFEDQSLTVYTKQLSLACLLLCCKAISPDGRPRPERIPEKAFEIDLVVQCIRGTQNPQTHHHALQLLSHTASMIPERVLHNMMDIFTFVGTSVVRRDDAYTYQIISDIIQSIIPTLIASKQSSRRAGADGADEAAAAEQAAVVPVLRVFADIILDVPEHRRLRLYTDLLNTLGAARYASVFLALLFESHVQKYPKAGSALGQAAEVNKRIDIGVEICNYFDSGTVLATCTQLIELLHRQPANVPTLADTASATARDDGQVFALRNYNDYQLRHFKYMTLQFVIHLTERSAAFVMKIARLTTAETVELKAPFKALIVTVLQFIGQMHRLTQTNGKIWRILMANCYDILDQVLALIYPDMLLQVVTGLLGSNNIPEVRRKALELLNKKLQQPEFVANATDDTFLRLLEPLATIIESIKDKEKLNKHSTTAENVSLQQQALIAIKILSVHMAHSHAPVFRQLLDTLAEVVKAAAPANGAKDAAAAAVAASGIPINVLAQSVLCLAELCSNLRAQAISHLSKFMPSLDAILQSQTQKLMAVEVGGDQSAGPNIIMYLLSAIHKIVEALPRFLSPYLVSLLTSMSTIWARLLQQQQHTAASRSAAAGGAAVTTSSDTQRKIAKLQQIWTQLSAKLTLRILIPMVDQCYRRIVEQENERATAQPDAIVSVSAVQPIMQLLAESLQPLTGTEINAFQSELGAFFLFALQMRSNNIRLDAGRPARRVQTDAQEDHVIGAFVGLVLKLSEASFRPLFQRIFDWAIREQDATIERAITFYRLSSRVAGALKSLFVLFSSDFMPNASELLAKYADTADDDDQESKPLIAQLIEAIVQTLNSIFLHDSQGFVNAHRFDVLLQPLVDQLQNPVVLADAALESTVVQCLAQMGVACADDSAWKQLNYQILLKTRHSDAVVRLLAMRACVELAKKLNDDFLPLLPETIPFFAELLEDDDAAVEKACQKRVQELERVLGEPLQKYF